MAISNDTSIGPQAGAGVSLPCRLSCVVHALTMVAAVVAGAVVVVLVTVCTAAGNHWSSMLVSVGKDTGFDK